MNAKLREHADLLRRAAGHVRGHLVDVTPGPWMSVGETNRKNSIALVGAVAKRGTGQAIAVLAGDPRTRHADARLIELMHPPVPEGLAALFDRAAAAMDSLDDTDRQMRMTEAHLAHLADLMEIVRLAREVLREGVGR
ncbi:hypothetical protein [Dactylosporangium sp. CA-139066]|uniref:hypothetical protein n=1 Tax=Dactylosporangium sp. CA-139066 TaxID=3239930 RepID=UPI003D90D701